MLLKQNAPPGRVHQTRKSYAAFPRPGYTSSGRFSLHIKTWKAKAEIRETKEWNISPCEKSERKTAGKHWELFMQMKGKTEKKQTTPPTPGGSHAPVTIITKRPWTGHEAGPTLASVRGWQRSYRPEQQSRMEGSLSGDGLSTNSQQWGRTPPSGRPLSEGPANDPGRRCQQGSTPPGSCP